MFNYSEVVIIAYSGHAYVACDIFNSQNIKVAGYCDIESKTQNPYNLSYLGKEHSEAAIEKIKQIPFFTAVGNNKLRRKISMSVIEKTSQIAANAIHINASISPTASLGSGIMIGNGSIINACATIGDGVICNTQSVIEHECEIGSYCHIAPGAVLCGNVKVGENTLIGARAVVKPGIKIGRNVIIGTGAVIIKDIPDDSKVVGNPQKYI